MADPRQLHAGSHWSSSWTGWLDRPLTAWKCVLGWCAATAIFVLVIQILGGPSTVDTVESTYSTWAIAHGHLACAFPPDTTYSYTAPVYPLVSGAIAALSRVGSTIPFPSTAALGAHCATALPAMSEWSAKARALRTTVDIGYVGWIFLMAGAISFLRACGSRPLSLGTPHADRPGVAPARLDGHPDRLPSSGSRSHGPGAWWGRVRAAPLVGVCRHPARAGGAVTAVCAARGRPDLRSGAPRPSTSILGGGSGNGRPHSAAVGHARVRKGASHDRVRVR